MALSHNAGSSVSCQRVTLERNGRRVEYSMQQMTVENLRKIFQVRRDMTCRTS